MTLSSPQLYFISCNLISQSFLQFMHNLAQTTFNKVEPEFC